MTTADPQYDGVYGRYTITEQDRREVQRYRIALLISGLAMSGGVLLRSKSYAEGESAATSAAAD